MPTPNPRLPPRRLISGFLSWPGLLLERTERQNKKSRRNETSPDFPFGNPREYREPHGNTGTALHRQCRTTRLMRSEQSLIRVEHVAQEKASHCRHTQAAGLDRDPDA